MKYYSLKKLFHMGENYKEQYERRKNSATTYNSNLTIKSDKENAKTLFLVNTKELMTLYEKISDNSKEIIKLQKKLPKIAKDKFFNLLLINELQSTNEIESVRSSKKEIAEALGNKENKEKYKKFISLAKMYQLIDENKEKLENTADIRKIYDNLVADEVDGDNILDGEIFRKSTVEVIDGHNTIHQGIYPEKEIINAVVNLLNFYNNAECPDLYKYMIFHYYFEYIHPFYDGNGRVGRYILGNMIANKFDKYSALTFSYTINRNKSKYYRSFIETNHPFNKGEITFFVKDMLEILKEGQEQIISYLEENNYKLEKIFNNLDEKISDKKDNEIFKILAISYLFSAKDNLITHAELAQIVSLTPQTLTKRLEKYKEKLQSISKKPKIYSLKDEYVNMLL